ncbi:hypothetical protein [Flectobacillus longus]|uniref:hypothetical protein n=1 Tax=Flectobacillus longus TaxID=2984207 RepID=UPI0024B7F0BD|nr:hypothetical protein [Flectobacillus longus]MDI9879567.1 hypothetical protein [Flectobacillus longus]
MFEILFGILEETKFPIDTAYFSCLDTRKVTKESQEILNSPAAQTIGFQKINTGFFIFNEFKHALNFG